MNLPSEEERENHGALYISFTEGKNIISKDRVS